MSRRPYIDWMRGVAVLVMIEWHALDAWTLQSDRDGTAFWLLSFVGGWAAPLFLFLAGVAVPLAGHAKLARGVSRRDACRDLQRRGWQVFLLAHLFRLQSFLLNPTARWSSLLKPDILNILGLGLVAAAAIWGRGRGRRSEAIWLLTIALAVVAITPLVRGWWWPSLLYPRFEAYLRPVGTFGVFSLFPWVGLLFAGATVGVYLADQPDTPSVHKRLALIGLSVFAIGMIGSFMPSPFALSSFWTTSISLFLIRSGVMTTLLPLAWLIKRKASNAWSPTIMLGRHSLFVYWVHVELAYGIFMRPWQKSFPLTEALIGFVLLTALMVVLTLAWQKWRRAPLIPPHLAVERA